MNRPQLSVLQHVSRPRPKSRDIFQIAPLKRSGMAEKLDPEAKRLRNAVRQLATITGFPPGYRPGPPRRRIRASR
jgi:hypothetical protein